MSCVKALTISEACDCQTIAGTHVSSVTSSDPSNEFWGIKIGAGYRGPVYQFCAQKDSAIDFGAYCDDITFRTAIYMKFSILDYDSLTGVVTIDPPMDWVNDFRHTAPYNTLIVQYLVMTGPDAGANQVIDNNTSDTITIDTGLSLVVGDVIAITIDVNTASMPNADIPDVTLRKYIRRFPATGLYYMAVAGNVQPINSPQSLTVVNECQFSELFFEGDYRELMFVGRINFVKLGAYDKRYRTTTASGGLSYDDTSVFPTVHWDHTISSYDHWNPGPVPYGTADHGIHILVTNDDVGVVFDADVNWANENVADYWKYTLPGAPLTETTASIYLLPGNFGLNFGPASGTMMLTLSDEWTDQDTWDNGTPATNPYADPSVTYFVEPVWPRSPPYRAYRGQLSLSCYGLKVGRTYTAHSVKRLNDPPFTPVATITKEFLATAKHVVVNNFYPIFMEFTDTVAYKYDIPYITLNPL